MATELTPQLAKLVVLKILRQSLCDAFVNWDKMMDEKITTKEIEILKKATQSEIDRLTENINHQSRVCGTIVSGW